MNRLEHVVHARQLHTDPPHDRASLTRLVLAGHVGTDPSFRSMLAADKQGDFHTAPQALRELLRGADVASLEFRQGYEHDGTHGSLLWQLNQVNFRDRVDEVIPRLATLLEQSGFSVQGDHADDGTVIRAERAHNDVRESMVLTCPAESPHPQGCTLGWAVADRLASTPPTLSSVLEEISLLRYEKLDPAVFDHLGGTPTVRLSLGGTWTRYYEWTVVLAPSRKGRLAARKLRSDVQRLLAKLGFRPERNDRKYVMYARKHNGSYAFLHKPDKCGRLKLSLQPRE